MLIICGTCMGQIAFNNENYTEHGRIISSPLLERLPNYLERMLTRLVPPGTARFPAR